MRIQRSRIARLPTGLLLVMAAATALPAQQPAQKPVQKPAQGTLSVGAEAGPRTYVTRLDALSIGKFQEYRDMRASNSASLLIEQLSVRYTPADSFGIYAFSARKLFDRDQSVFVRAARPSEYDFQLRFDRIPHTYTTTARSPGGELGNPGFNSLPAPRPDSIAWRNGSYLGPVRTQWDPMKATLAATPNKNLDLKAEYTNIGKKGGIPRSISFSGSGGPQREFVSPIDQSVSDFRLSQDYASGDRTDESTLAWIKSYQFSIGYAYSMFRNSIKSTMVDNPLLAVSSPTTGTQSARVSLEPSNSAQTATATGAVLFPWRTRITGSLTASWARQNDPLFPQTSNDSLQTNANYPLVGTLPRASLDGRERRWTYHFSATSHPMSKLTLTAKHRSFDLSDNTEPFQIRAMVVSDRSIAPADSEKFEAHPFTKTNTNLGASWNFMRGLALSAGYGWEDWTRDPSVRNLEHTEETSPVASLDYTTLDWLSLRASYFSASRRGSKYTEARTEILNFRRYDQSDRDRTRATFTASVTPIDPVTVALTYQAGGDKFPNSQYGVVEDRSTMTGVDLDWSPSERYSASIGWSQEDVKDSANYRYRTGAVGSATYDNVSYRWMNTNKDKNTNLYAALNATIIPGKLDAIGTWAVSDSHWWMYNVNPTTPTGGTAAQNLSATAQDWPEVRQRLEPISVAMHYRYSREWAITFRYNSEKYSQTDFRTVAPVFTSTGLNGGTVSSNYPAGELPGTIGQVSGSNTGQYHFLGANFRPYKVDWVTITVSYNPSLLQWSRGRAVF